MYSGLGCGLEADATAAEYMCAAGPALHGTAQIRVWIFEAVMGPLKYYLTSNQFQNLGAKNLC